MAIIQNDRDVLLQAAAIRVVPVVIQIGDVAGLGDALKRIEITSSTPSFVGASGTPTPTTITLTAQLKNGLTGAVTWAVVSGSASITPSGLNCTVSGSSVSGNSVTIRASVTDNGITHSAQTTLYRYGNLSAADRVNLVTQVTGQLASGNVTGLGALALLNKVDLNTQTVGALNGSTQVTNLGTLAYANAIAANQIGAGTLAAGVIYAGSINADNITSGTITGRTLRTAASGDRVVINGTDNTLTVYKSGAVMFDCNPNLGFTRINATGAVSAIEIRGGSGPGIDVASSGNAGKFSSNGGNGVISEHIGSGSGAAVFGTAIHSGTGLAGTSGTGWGGVFENRSGVKSALRIVPTNILPSDKTAGSICYHTTHGFCVANGTSWYVPTTWNIVT